MSNTSGKISEKTTVTVGLLLALLTFAVGFSIDYLTTKAHAAKVPVIEKKMSNVERAIIRIEIQNGTYDPKNWRE